MNVDTETILLGFAKFCKVDVTMEMDVGNVKNVLSDGESEKAKNRYMEARLFYLSRRPDSCEAGTRRR